MNDQARRRGVGDALRAVDSEGAGAERYRRSLRQATNGSMETGHARPLEFDESGFPIPQRPRSFVSRVTRLLSPD
jgi:hypothetical protein